MVEHTIQMRKRNGEQWDNLNPITKTENVLHKTGETVDMVLERTITEKETFVYYFDFSLTYSSKAILVIAGGKTIMIDFGDRNHSSEAVQKINNLGIDSVDIGIITHYHSDHSGGLQNFIDGGVIDSNTVMYLPPTPDWERMKTIGSASGSNATGWEANERTTFNALNTANVEYLFPSEKKWIDLGEQASMRFHNTLETYFEAYYNDLYNDNVFRDGVDYNNFSLVTEIKNGNKHFVFTGDLALQGQKQLRNTFDNPIYFYDVEHHGLNYSYDSDYYKQLNPKYVGIQNADEDYSYFSRGAYGYLKSLGADIFITGVNGDISFHDKVDEMDIDTQIKGSAKTGKLQSYSLTGGYTVLENGTHLDDVMDAGVYIARTIADVNGLSGLPSNENEQVDSSFKLVVETYHDGSRLRQTLYENSGRGYIWYRVYSTNDQWNPWFRVMRTSDLTPEEEPDGTGTHLAQGDDLDDLMTVGKYSAPSNIVAQNTLNKPEEVEVGFTVEVYPLQATERLYQVLYENIGKGGIWYRVYSTNEQWNPWFKLATMDDLPPEPEQDDGTGQHLIEGDDLNDLSTVGKYSAPTTPVAESIINKPAEVSVAFTIEVYPLHHVDRFYQILRTATPDTDEYTRLYTGSWHPWSKVQKQRVEI